METLLGEDQSNGHKDTTPQTTWWNLRHRDAVAVTDFLDDLATCLHEMVGPTVAS